MNTQYLYLSSTNTANSVVLPTLVINDHTTLFLNLSGITERLFPMYLEVDWGDGKTDFYENNILQSVNLVEDRYSPILLDICSHEYLPSQNSTSESLTGNIYLKYINGDFTTFTLPISLINYDFQNALEDIILINTESDILGRNTHKFLTKKGGYIVEMQTPTK